MRYAVASAVAFAAVAVALPQGVTEQIKPDDSAPEGCSPSYDGEFEIQVTNVSSTSTKRSIHKVRRSKQLLARHQ